MAKILNLLSQGKKILKFFIDIWKKILDLFIKTEVWGYLIFSGFGLFILLIKTKITYGIFLTFFLINYLYLSYRLACSIYMTYKNINLLITEKRIRVIEPK